MNNPEIKKSIRITVGGSPSLTKKMLKSFDDDFQGGKQFFLLTNLTDGKDFSFKTKAVTKSEFFDFFVSFLTDINEAATKKTRPRLSILKSPI